jgi:KDO2-lipid IV(A) lauroyltransferase
MTHLQKAYAKGKGVLMITAHAGNWEFMSVTVTSAGYPLNVVYRPLNFKPADNFLYRYRTRFGTKLIPKRRSTRKILKALQKKECVGILFDQDPGLANGVFVNFFGQPTCTNKGLAFLALKTEAPVLPVFIVRQEKKFLLEFGEEIPLYRSSDMEKDIAVNTLSYNRAIEAFIRKHPEQWFWVHRRWKHSHFAGAQMPNSPAYQPITPR